MTTNLETHQRLRRSTARLTVGLCLLSIVFCCRTRSDVYEIRGYKVYGIIPYEQDSVLFDTVCMNQQIVKGKNDLFNLIHAIDSALMKSDSTRMFGKVSLEPRSRIHFKEYDMIPYYASVETQQGTLSFYGIHLKGWGTMYWRWLDGRTTLLVQNSRSSMGQEREFNELGEFLDSLIYSTHGADSSLLNLGFRNDSVNIELDTAFLKSQGIKIKQKL